MEVEATCFLMVAIFCNCMHGDLLITSKINWELWNLSGFWFKWVKMTLKNNKTQSKTATI